jgi:FAD/FMN-containing dehydrogenase
VPRPAPSLDPSELRGTIRGRIVEPGDPDYDEVRKVFLGDVDRRPAAIVRVADAGDVAATISFAREGGHELAIRSGGHSGAGHGTTNGGIVIDLRDMKGLEIDVVTRTAWAETGLTAGEMTVAAAEHGLGVGFGDTGSVGIGGITLGGGVGFLSRRYGLTIDNLLAAEVVTADGRTLLVDPEHEPDLFWAIRGGGGNVGVVTRFQYRLQPVDPFVGGILVLPATAETVAGFVEAAAAAPDELSTIANVMPAPPMPFLPEGAHGSLVILGMVGFLGDATAAERVFAPFRALATPIADLVRPMPYPEMYPPDDEEYRPTAVSRTMFIDHVDLAVGRTIIRHLASSGATMRVAQIRVIGGAVARVPAELTAYAHRSSPIMVNVAAFYEGRTDRSRRRAWVNRFVAALDQGEPGAYVNFLGDEGEERVHAAYPAGTWDRLAEIKARYDPTNLFRLNQNVPPASEDAAA